MKFRITSLSGAVVGDGLDKHADAIRLREGTPEPGQKKPMDLGKGEETRVSYPLEAKKHRTYVVSRTE